MTFRLLRVCKRYPNGVMALSGIDLHIAAGELLTLVGPSGSGKTTLLRLLAGLENPTAGELFLDGKLANRRPPWERGVALVFQRYSLHPLRTIAQNFSISAAWGERYRRRYSASSAGEHGQSPSELVEQYLVQLGLADVRNRYPDQLSGGQQQRAALGRAIVRLPRFLLLDEPLSNLDPGLRAGLRHCIARLHQSSDTTIVYVTHDWIDAMALGKRLAVLNAGHLQQVGSPQEVFDRPANRFVAGFLGWPPLNLVAGQIRGDGQFFTSSGWQLTLCRDTIPTSMKGKTAALTIGIRPEDLTLQCAVPGSDAPKWRVETVETLGSESILTVRRDSLRLLVRTVSRVWHAGQIVQVDANTSRALAFDAETGMALTREDAGG